MSRLEQIKNKNKDLLVKGLPYDISFDDVDWLISVAEAAIMTRNMLKACIGKPIDETATIFLDKAFEGVDYE